MKKIETIWHYLLFEALEKGQFQHTQQEIAKRFGYSLSTINYALAEPSAIGAIRKESKFFVLENCNKLLYFWASQRSLQKEIIYETYYPATALEIEGLLPPASIYACYSSAKKILKEVPADYEKVYLYIANKELNEIKRRFPKNKEKEPNVFVFKLHPSMAAYGQITTLPQTFVDIWNLKDWYGQDFIKALEQKINEKLGILS